MNKFFISLICILSLGLSSCMRPSGNMRFCTDVPAIVGYDLTIGQPILITVDGTFVVPDLREFFLYAVVAEGDAVLATFLYDEHQEPIDGYQTVLEFDCYKVGITTAVEESAEVDIADCAPIEDAYPFGLIFHEGKLVLYMAFHQETTFRKYRYEITYDIDETTTVPTLSIRSKTDGDEYATPVGYQTPYVFEIYDYIMSQEKDEKNQVSVNVRYRKGVDSSGNEIWAYCAENPLPIPVP